MQKKRKQSKLNMLAAVYVVIAIFVVVMSAFSLTFAWYIKTESQHLNITFAKPIVVDITTQFEMDPLAVGTPQAVIPGDNLSFNIGLKMSNNSSKAYVRARLVIEFEHAYDENGVLADWHEVTVKDSNTDAVTTGDINSADWVLVNFSRDPMKPDYWYVLKLAGSSNTEPVTRILNPGDELTFLYGTVSVSKELDNKYANKNIFFNFQVQTLQVENIEDPLGNGIMGAKLHEQWGTA